MFFHHEVMMVDTAGLQGPQAPQAKKKHLKRGNFKVTYLYFFFVFN